MSMPHLRFWCHMSYDEPMTTSGESSIGDQRNISSKPCRREKEEDEGGRCEYELG